MPSLNERFRHAWDAFRGRDHPYMSYERQPYVQYVSERPDRISPSFFSGRSDISTIYSRIAVDAASCTIRHVIVDDNENYKDDVKSDLSTCLKLSPNIDQDIKSFLISFFYSMFDEGVIAAVPIHWETDDNDNIVNISDIRVGQIVQWGAKSVKLKVYNEENGQKQDIIMPKKYVVIVQNPFYEIMNAENSLTKRLVAKQALLDRADNNAYNGKMNIIIQLPYSTRTEKRKEAAEARTREMEEQLSKSQYGVAYSDVSEKIIQLNRSVENNLYQQVKDLKQEIYNKCGLTEDIFNGTADEKTILNYYETTIAPVLEVFTLEATRKWISKDNLKAGQRIKYSRNPFRIVPAAQLAEIADKLTRNAILSSNEMRAIMGFKPVDDPRANELRNKNLNATEEELQNPIKTGDDKQRKEETSKWEEMKT